MHSQWTGGFRVTVGSAMMIAFVMAGCAENRPRAGGSTLGADMFRGPSGVTYPASSLGVDLVKRPGESSRDSATLRVSAP